MMLRDIGEDRLLAKILPKLPLTRNVVRGVGDDCAVLKFKGARDLLLLKTDCVVEQIHFTSDTDASAVGWKAMMRTLSDFAAMSGVPQFALITLAIEGSRNVDWVEKFYRGLRRAAARFDVAIVGGETSATNGPTVVAVSAAGYAERDRCVLRSGGKAGDDLFITGFVGGSRAGHHLDFVARIKEARWLTSHFQIHAMLDLSDGLGADLPRLAAASNLGFFLETAALPVTSGCSVDQAVSDGEDYELLFAIPPAHGATLARKWRRRFPNVRLTRIGQLISKSKTGNDKLPAGYVHFRKRR